MFNSQVILNIILLASMLLLVATSFHIIYTVTKFYHFAHGAVISLGAYFVFFFVNKFSCPFPLAIGFAIASTIFFGVFCEVLVYRYLRKKNVPTLSYLISSIGLYVVFQNCISLYFGDDTLVINRVEVTIGNEILGAYITTVQISTICISIALYSGIYLFLKFTSTGKSIRAVASNPALCNIFGIDSNRVVLIAFIIGSAFAAIAGILSAMDTNMTPAFGFNLFLYGVVAMIVSGIGSIRGLIASSLLIASAQHFAAYYVDTKWMDAITYIFLIIFLVWSPLGFSGKRLKKVEV